MNDDSRPAHATDAEWFTAARQRLGQRIDRRRRAASLSQEEIGQKLNVHQTQVSRWLRGEAVPSWLHIRSLALVLDTTPVDLLWPLLDGPWGARQPVIDALATDPSLTETQSDALIGVYSSMVDR